MGADANDHDGARLLQSAGVEWTDAVNLATNGYVVPAFAQRRLCRVSRQLVRLAPELPRLYQKTTPRANGLAIGPTKLPGRVPFRDSGVDT